MVAAWLRFGLVWRGLAWLGLWKVACELKMSMKRPLLARPWSGMVHDAIRPRACKWEYTMV